MIFWAIAAALTALAVGGLLAPLLRRAAKPAPRAAYDLAVYRDQLAELERDAARGLLAPEQVAAARLEVERRLLAAADARGARAAGAQETATTPRGSGRALVLAIAAGLPIAALGLYLALGAPDTPSRPGAEPEPAVAGELGELAEALARRLEAQPDDRDGWLLLGRTYARLERFDAAAQAYGQAIAAGFDEAALHAARGEALAAAAGGTVTPEARLAFAAALERDPNEARARYYAGLALAQDGRLDEALELWTGLLAEAPPDAPWREVVARQIAQARTELGRPAEDVGSGPSAAELEAAAALSAEERAALVQGMVDRLAARLEAQPEDLEGWLRLARAYAVLGQPARAEAALGRARALAVDLPAQAPQRAALDEIRRLLGQAR